MASIRAEANAERVAGTLEAMESIYESIDKECEMENRNHRISSKDKDAVVQITNDLISQSAFNKTDFFPKFERSLFHKLDYRDLHKWIKEHAEL